MSRRSRRWRPRLRQSLACRPDSPDTGWRRPGRLCRLGGRRAALVLAVLTSAATSCAPGRPALWFGDLEVLAVLGRELEQAMQPIALAAMNQRDETMAPRRGILFGVVCGCPLG